MQACTAAIVLSAPAAWANVLYNFNQDEQGWSSTSSPAWLYTKESANEGSWKAFCDGAVSVRYLYSPCLKVDDPSYPKPSSIDIDFQHRFHFQANPAGEPFWGAGQVQYMLNASGTWLGITGWESSGGELPPTFSVSGTSAYAPPLISPGDAFVGTSPKYANSGAGGVYDKSSFQISGLTVGDEIKFRFVAAMFVSGSCPSLIDPLGSNPIWELDDFEVKGVVEAECVPEPAGLTTLLGACAVWLGWCIRRRWSPPRSLMQCAAESALALATLSVVPASASAEITSTFNFNISSGSITPSPQGIYTKPPITQQWLYRVAGPNSDPYLSGTNTKPTWNVRSSPVSGTAVATGNYLTSPLIQLGAAVDQFILRVAHRYRLPGNGSGLPIDAGQITYSIDGAVYLPIAPSQWKSSGPVDNSLKPYVTPSNWGSVAVPTFVPGVGSTPPVYLLTNGGASFTGDSAGFDAGNFVGSETLTIKFPQATQTVEFRFTNVNLGNDCGINGGWDLAFVEASFIEAPEPGGFVLAAVGGAISVLGWMRRRARRRGTSVTNEPPNRA